MNKKELFTIQPFESLLNLQSPLVIEERPNSGSDALNQDFNLIHNNVYIDLKDYQTFIREGIPETKITNRGSIFNADYISLVPKFPDISGTPYLELFSNDTGDFLNVYQESSFRGHSSFMGGVSIDNYDGLNLVDTSGSSLEQIKLKMEYDEAFSENVLSFLKLPEPAQPQDQVDYYQNLKVKDLFILGTTYYTNVEDLFLQDPIVDLNKLQDGTVPQEQITGFQFNEPQLKYSKFVFDPNYNGDDIQQFVLTEKGYQDPQLETFQDLYLNNLYQVGLLNTPQVETDQISTITDGLLFNFNTTQNFEDELIVNKQNTKVVVTNLLESQEIKQNHVYTDSTTAFNSEQEQYYFDSQLNNFVIDKFTFVDNKFLIDDSQITIQNSLESDITLNLTGDLNVSSDTTLTNLEVTNDINLQTGVGQTLTVDGFSTFNNGQEINSGLDVYDGQTINEQTVSGQLTQGQSGITSTIYGNVNIGTLGNTSTIQNDQTFNQDVSIGGTTTTTGDVQLNSDTISIGNSDQTIDINGDITLSQVQKTTHVLGDFEIDGTWTLNDDLTISNKITQQNFESTDNTLTNTLVGTLRLSQSTKQTRVLGTLQVDEVQTFMNNLIVQNNLYTNGNTIFGTDNTKTSTIRGTVNLSAIGYETNVKGQLDVDGITNMYGDVNIYNTDFGVYDQTSNLKFNVTDVKIDNNLDTYMNEQLYLTKNLIGNNSLQNHTLQGNVTVTSAGKNFNVLGNSSFAGTSDFTGDQTFEQMTVNGSQIFNESIIYNDEMTFNNLVNFMSTVNVPQYTVINIGTIDIYYDTATQTLIVE